MRRSATIKRAARRARELVGWALLPSDVNPAIEFLNWFVFCGGLALDPTRWHPDAQSVLRDELSMALSNGWSATRAAAHFASSELALACVKVDARDLRDRGSLISEEIESIFRTVINRAHGEALAAAGEKTPGFGGWRYLLSPRHAAPDICDLLSTQNLHGLGPGVYPDRERTPWPAHPNTLSFLEIVFADEVSDADRAGRETSLEALAALTTEQKEGVLGRTKAGYFERGLLRSWMIRSSLQSVQKRLIRRGLIDANDLETDPSPWADDEDDE